MRVLLCGESWVTHSLHIKGVDSFTTSSYVEGAGHLRAETSQQGVGADVRGIRFRGPANFVILIPR